MADATTLNEWASYDYRDPEPVLAAIRKVQESGVLQAMPEDVANMRTNALKSSRESRDAAIFAFGMGVRLGTKVLVARVEDADFDFMTTWIVDGTRHFCPVQLKEWVPESLNPSLSLDDLFDKIARKYPLPTDTTVAVLLNREIRLDLESLRVPELHVRELYLFAATSPDQLRWLLIGNLLGEPYLTEFQHPT